MFAGKIQQGVEVFGRLKIDVSPPTAVAAVGATFRNVLFAAEAQTAIAAIACLNPDFCLVNKHLSVLQSA